MSTTDSHRTRRRRSSSLSAEPTPTVSVSPVSRKCQSRSPLRMSRTNRGSMTSPGGGGGYFVRPKAPVIKSTATKEVAHSSPTSSISWARPVMDVRQKSLLGTKVMPILECSFYKKLHPEEEEEDATDAPTTTAASTTTGPRDIALPALLRGESTSGNQEGNDMYFL